MIILLSILFSLNEMKRLFAFICRVTNFTKHIIELEAF